ncbi:MAG: hypothetical protein RIR18_1799 [Pseudomonadota bacterium]|jgi:hypothetical protein
MQARKLTAIQGWRWLSEAYAIYRKAPSRLGLVVMGYWLCVLLLNAIPVVGPVLTSILIPALSVGVMNACRQIDLGKPVEPIMLFSALNQESKANRKTLFFLGGTYLLTTFGVLSISVMVDGGQLLSLMTGQIPINDETLAHADISFAALTVLTLLLPVLMAYWYAPILAGWYGLPVLKSLFFSFIACLRNGPAFLAYGVSLFLFGVLLPVTVLSMLSAVIPEASGLLAAMVIVPMVMVFAPTVMASFYVSYRDVFAVSEDA